MSGNTLRIQRQITSSHGLKSVVRTMKAMAAVSIGPYERALLSLDINRAAIEQAFTAIFRQAPPELFARAVEPLPGITAAIVIGSDQGMVGAFNERLAQTALAELAGHPSAPKNLYIWTVGERLHRQFEQAPGQVFGPCAVPESVEAIPSLMSRLLLEIDSGRAGQEFSTLTVYFNRPAIGAGFEPTKRLLLPFDRAWLEELARRPWPTRQTPQAVGGTPTSLAAVVREHLFLSLFDACARSGASEHATRLAAMMRAEKSIDERLEDLQRSYHAERQAAIMEELFDVGHRA